MKLTIETFKCEDGGYIAKVNEINCIGDGDTELEALRDLTEVMLDILELADEDGVISLGK